MRRTICNKVITATFTICWRNDLSLLSAGDEVWVMTTVDNVTIKAAPLNHDRHLWMPDSLGYNVDALDVAAVLEPET